MLYGILTNSQTESCVIGMAELGVGFGLYFNTTFKLIIISLIVVIVTLPNWAITENMSGENGDSQLIQRVSTPFPLLRVQMWLLLDNNNTTTPTAANPAVIFILTAVRACVGREPVSTVVRSAESPRVPGCVVHGKGAARGLRWLEGGLCAGRPRGGGPLAPVSALGPNSPPSPRPALDFRHHRAQWEGRETT
jgi:hypothetical protein